MNYVLQVVRGRSATTTLKLAEGVTSLGRSDDCWIRIKSSQVSRKHCELHEIGDQLNIRDLGSSNGTWVNGKRIAGQQVLKAGDELTVGGVTLRVAVLGQEPPVAPKPKAGDTAVVDAIAVPDDEEEFELEFDEDEVAVNPDLIPLAEDDTAPKVEKPVPSAKAATTGKPAAPAGQEKKAETKPKKAEKEDEAIAEFLLDLKLEDEE